MSSTSESDREMLDYLFLWDEEESSSSAESRILCRVNYMTELNDYDFMYRFRLSKTAVNDLLVQIQPHLQVTSSRNHGVAPLLQLLLALRYYALGTMLVSVADYVGVSIPTASRIVASVSRAIGCLYSEHVKLEDYTQLEFYSIAGFPRVHGAVDCTHIPIQSPCSNTYGEFRNRKGKFSLNVQVVCNANLIFQDVVARWPGSASDATIFHNSSLKTQCEEGRLQDRWLLGDSAYRCTSYLLTPIVNPSSRSEELYNEAHMKTRNTIERCISVWKRRFPVLSLKMRLKLNTVQAVIIATSVLHNIARRYNIQDLEPEVHVEEEEDHDACISGTATENFGHSGEEVSTRLDMINKYFGSG